MPGINTSNTRAVSSRPRLSFSMNNSIYDILNDDFRNSSIENDSVDLVFTDLPWSKEEMLGIASDLGLFGMSKLKKGHLLATYAGTYTWELTKQFIGQHLTFVACKHFKRVGLRHDSYDMAAHGKIDDLTILFFFKGEPSDEQIAQINSFELQTEGMDKTWHEWGQPVSEWIQLIQHFSRPGDLVVDPMAGGGTAVQACIDSERSCVAYEKEAKCFEVIKRRLSKYLIPQTTTVNLTILYSSEQKAPTKCCTFCISVALSLFLHSYLDACTIGRVNLGSIGLLSSAQESMRVV
ncbi:MAG TPA: DNA methyltransferase [Nitrososphaerales archaeon]|nr:DNA methyltransferase [Nitrososphaerales archaeon]